MERAAEILAPEVRTRPVIVESVKPPVLKVEPQRIITPELLLNLKKEFEGLSMYVSRLRFEPSEENFTRVVITPLLGEVDFVQYEIAEKLKVKAMDNLEKAVSKAITIQIIPKDVEAVSSQQVTSIEEIKNLFDIKCEDRVVSQKISEAYILLETLSKIRELSTFNIKLRKQTLEIYLECGLKPENVKNSYEALKEAAWWTKFYLLI